LALAPQAIRFGTALASDGTPVAGPGFERTEFLFVQAFERGSWQPIAGTDDQFKLTIEGSLASTVYFSDRPERVVGISPTDLFINALGFTPVNPPNAAIVVGGETSVEVVVVELSNAIFDASANILTYDATVLDAYESDAFGDLEELTVKSVLPESLGPGALFIDDCADTMVTCTNRNGAGMMIQIACCYNYPSCYVCDPNVPGGWFYKACNSRLPDHCAGGCTADRDSCDPPRDFNDGRVPASLA
jgi:hypothetical protein